MFRSITWRVGIPFISLIVVILVSLGGFLAASLKTDAFDALVSHLEKEAWIAAEAALPALLDPARAPDALAKRLGPQIGARITLITADGTVVGDSEEDPPTMENYATRPEVRDALISGRGESGRYSATMGMRLEYVAVQIVNQGKVLGVARVGLPLGFAEQASQQATLMVLWATVIAAIAAIFLAVFISRVISLPIRELTDASEKMASGEWEQSIPVRSRDEVGRLAHTFNEMSLHLQRDIAARERAEVERERTLAFVQSVMDGLPESMMVINRDHSIALANRKAVEIGGGLDPVALGLKCHQVSHQSATPCEGPSHPCPLEQAVATKLPNTVEHIHHDAAGIFASLEITAAPLFDEEGEVVQIIESCRDLTERKQMEAKLRERAETISDIAKTSKDWVWSIDLQGIHTYSNNAIERILGCSLDDVVGESSLDLMHQEDRQMVEVAFPLWVVEKRGWTGLVVRWRHKDGSWRFLESSAVPIFDEEGEIVGFRGVDRDITDRMKAEAEARTARQHLEDLLDNANCLIVVWNSDLRVTRFNRAFEDLTGLSANQVIGQSLEQVFPEDSREASLAHASAATRGEAWRGVELPVRHIDGRAYTVLWNFATLVEEDGVTPQATIGQGQDITARKRAEKEVMESRDRLRMLTARLDEVREEERTKLSRELHDEVGQSLTAMRMDLESLEGEFPEGGEALAGHIRPMIEMTQDSVDRVNRMSSELRSPILDLLGLEAAVESEVWEYQERRGINVVLEMELGELEALPARDLTIYRVLLESLANTRRHAQASRVDVKLRAEGEEVVLEVLDDGIGVTEEQALDHRSFGLMGMRERVGRVGGSFEIERRPEGGTRVRAAVPVASLSADEC